MFGIRRIRQGLEAKLRATDGPARGKIECKWYSDGGERLKLKLSATGLPDGADVALRIGGADLALATVSGGGVRLDREGPLPALTAGNQVEVVHDATVIASGTLNPD